MKFYKTGFKTFSFKLAFLLLFSVITNAQVVDSNLIIGEYRILKVTDGDTFRFEGLDASTRLLGIDTEETFKDKNAREKSYEISLEWPQEYNLIQSQKKNGYPVKCDSPFGFETWEWAKDFTTNIESVRIEKDDTNRGMDAFGRYLVYLMMKKAGKYINYNIECVRLGYSPYYNKYGNSKRFHKEFMEAQEYAKKNKIGIWNTKNKCYPDYERRLVWWNKRAIQIENFEKKFANIENYFNISNDGEYDRLSNYVGKEVVVFGTISEILKQKFPILLRFSVRKGVNFDVVIYEENESILNNLNLDEIKEYYVFVKGKLSEYNNRLQIILNEKYQIWLE
jgi:endonuclease YncB( thermonuclease family)